MIETQELSVVFNPPAIGMNQVPIRLAGEGMLRIEENGLWVRAAKAGRGRGALVIMVCVVMFVIGVAIAIKLDFDAEFATFLIIAVIAPVAGFLIKRPAREGRTEEHHFPWANIKKIYVEDGSIVIVIKKMTPKGALYIEEPKGERLEMRLNAAHKEARLKLK